MGIGQALLEATTTDRDTARILNPGLSEYLSPAHADVPLIDVAFIEEHDGNIHVLGVKGIGELPCGGRKRGHGPGRFQHPTSERGRRRSARSARRRDRLGGLIHEYQLAA